MRLEAESHGEHEMCHLKFEIDQCGWTARESPQTTFFRLNELARERASALQSALAVDRSVKHENVSLRASAVAER